MTMPILPVVTMLTRGWLHVYTCRLPVPLAEARRAEIESDIWEMEHDPDVAPGLRGASMAMLRLIDGMTDDIAWRFDNAAIQEQLIVRRLFTVTAATVLVLSLWTVPSLFLNGQREVAACAAAAPKPQTDADLRLEVMRCAGAFFSSTR